MKWFLVFTIISMSTQASQLVTEVVGKTDFSVLTSREVQINSAIEYILFGEPKELSKNLVLDTKDKIFQDEVSRTIIEVIIFQEAKTFNLANIPKSDVDVAVKELMSKIQKRGLLSQWNRMQPEPSEVRETIIQKLRAKSFIRFKTAASKVPITDAEALEYFQENRSKFGHHSFLNFKDKIKAFMEKEQSQNRITDWFQLLQRKYKVQKLGGLKI